MIESVLFQTTILENLFRYLAFEDASALLQAFRKEQVLIPFLLFDSLNHLVLIIPGKDITKTITTRVVKLIRKRGSFGALKVAVQNNQCAIVKHCIRMGLTILPELFFDAIKFGHNSMVSLLCDLGFDIETTDMYGQTALVIAAEANQIEIVSNLISRGATVNPKDPDAWPALLEAAHAGNDSLISILLEAKANVNIFVRGSNPLIMAAMRNHSSTVSLLCDAGAEINVRTRSGVLLLQMADPRIVPLLCERGADVNIRGRLRNTPLISAVLDSNHSLISTLLKYRADVNLRNDLGQSAFDLAGEDEITLALLSSVIN